MNLKKMVSTLKKSKKMGTTLIFKEIVSGRVGYGAAKTGISKYSFAVVQ